MATEAAAPLFSQIRDWAEIVYFFSGPFMVAIASFGLWQIKLTKDQVALAADQLELTKKDIHSNVEISRTQSRRAAVETAVVECRRYSEEIVQAALELQAYCKEHDVTYFDDVKFERTEKGFKLHTKEIKHDDLDKLSNAEPVINRYLNGMEAFALFFLSGVADEHIAFHTNGKTFVKMAEEAFKIFPVCNVAREDAQPIKALYFRWRDKLDAQKMLEEKDNIERKLKDMDQKEIKPIGT